MEFLQSIVQIFSFKMSHLETHELAGKRDGMFRIKKSTESTTFLHIESPAFLLKVCST